MLSASEISYIREWAASGNEPRPESEFHRSLCRVCVCTEFPGRRLWVLDPSGLTIARLADALEQANKVAESRERVLYYERGHQPDHEIYTMRQNHTELLGEK